MGLMSERGAERQRQIDAFKAERRPAAWIHGWWRYQMRRADAAQVTEVQTD
jgi:hypothetical protein